MPFVVGTDIQFKLENKVFRVVSKTLCEIEICPLPDQELSVGLLPWAMLEISGTLSTPNPSQLAESVNEEYASRCEEGGTLVLNLEKLDRVDSSGIAFLLQLRRLMRRRHLHLKLHHPNPQFISLLSDLEIIRLFDIESQY